MFKYAESIVKRLVIRSCLFLYISIVSFSQRVAPADSALTLTQCIDYALKHQPFINQALINETIVRTTNAINLSTWYPQVNVHGNLTHYNSLPTALIKNSPSGILDQGGRQAVIICVFAHA